MEDTPSRTHRKIDLDDLADERNRRLLAYWMSSASDAGLPARDDIDPIDMTFILGNVVLINVLRDPLRFQYRLIGTNLTAFLGVDLTGTNVDQHPDRAFREMIIPTLEEVVETGEPFAMRVDSIIDDRVRQFEAVSLPMASDGRTVDMILAGQCLLDIDRSLA